MKRAVLIATMLIGSVLAAPVTVTVSAYNALAGQADSTPTITATGTRVREGIVALSPNLRQMFPYKSKVEILCKNGYRGVFRVEDSTSSRYWNRVDIFMRSYKDAIQWGVKTCQIKKFTS